MVVLAVGAVALADTATAPLSTDDVMIVYAANAKKCRPGKYFTPDLAEVQKATAQIREALRRYTRESSPQADSARAVLEHLTTYQRFYTGEVTKRGKVIIVDGRCVEYVKEAQCAAEIKDGGTCVWRLVWDVKRAAFVEFASNGSK